MGRYQKVRQNDKYVREHRVIAAQILGRPLTDLEVVHHIDNNGLNNKPENLMVFSSTADHTIFHSVGCNTDFLSLNPDGTYSCQEESKEIKYCLQCGKPFTVIYKTNKNSFCSRVCTSKSQRKVVRPDKDTLQNEVNKLGYKETGRKYGVSDNTVRRWIR